MGRALLVGVLVCAGCYLSHERATQLLVDVPDNEPVPLHAFCAEMARAICEGAGSCDCSVSGNPVDAGACTRRLWADCAGADGDPLALLDQRAMDLIASGAIVYDPAAARAAIEDFRRGASGCGWAGEWLEGWTARDLFSLRGAFVGTLEPGQACEPIRFDGHVRGTTYGYLSECRMGHCADEHCVAAADYGEPCGADRACMRLDAPVRTDEGTGTDHVTGLSQFFDRNFSPISPLVPGAWLRCDGRCVEQLAAGEPCATNEDCASMFCTDGRCEAQGAIGEACEWPWECQSGACSSSQTCDPGELSLGFDCSGGASMCASDACYSGVCTLPVCYELGAGLYW